MHYIQRLGTHQRECRYWDDFVSTREGKEVRRKWRIFYNDKFRESSSLSNFLMIKLKKAIWKSWRERTFWRA